MKSQEAQWNKHSLTAYHKLMLCMLTSGVQQKSWEYFGNCCHRALKMDHGAPLQALKFEAGKCQNDKKTSSGGFWSLFWGPCVSPLEAGSFSGEFWSPFSDPHVLLLGAFGTI